MKKIISVLLVMGLISCQKSVDFPDGSAGNQPHENKPDSTNEKPQNNLLPEFESVKNIWTFGGFVDPKAPLAVLKCADDVSLDEECPVLNEKCFHGERLFQCWPEDLTLTFRGFVLDQDGKGIADASVGAVLGSFDNEPRTMTKTRSDGSFQILSPRTCLRIFEAQKEGYFSSTGNLVSATIINCPDANWGRKNIKIYLYNKRNMRTLI